MEEYLQKQLTMFLSKIRPADGDAVERAWAHWDGIAKPLRGLGRMEELICRIAGIQGTPEVRIGRRAVVVFCADNGVVEEGVTQTDSSVTQIVTDNFARGIASVNRMAEIANADVFPIDIGIDGYPEESGVRDMKIAPGTANFTREPAMTREQALEAIHAGIRVAAEMQDMGYDLLACGEMGIGNTTTTAAVAAVLLGLPVETVTGRGAGLSSEGLKRKIEVIKKGIAMHKPDPNDPIAVLSALGGFDIAGLCGLMIGAAIYHIPVVLDGVITAVAALLAARMCPQVKDYLLPSHLGKEPVCQHVMTELGFAPVIHGDLALGEGTGAVMLFPLLDMAHAVYRENTTFADIEIEAYKKFD